MDAKSLLDQLLQSGKKIAEQGMAQTSELAEKGKGLAEQGMAYAQENLNFPEAGPEREKFLKNLGIGAAAGGMLALLVGTKSGRKVLSPAVKLGSLAALGGLGYKIYADWKKDQGGVAEGQSISNLDGDAANSRSLAIVKAMIAAAKADGHIDAEEQAVIIGRIKSSELEDSAAEILMAEMQKPLDVATVAAVSDSPESAVEIYLASLLLTDNTNSAERNYLDQLSAALGMNPELAARLESEAFATG
ncbi:MAG: tellurite resistance TerB family protein [Mariniblastus sp.]